MTSQEKTFGTIAKLQEIELELHRLRNALDRANKALDAQRTWVGLTDEEVDDIGCDFATLGGDIDAKDWFAFYLAIEAKLKEKNT